VSQSFSSNSDPAVATLEPVRPAAVPQAGPLIRVSRLGKSFRLYSKPWARLAEWLTLGRAVRHQDFWALRDVSFDVRRGASLGIIGVNGSGKSTLLKILSGAMYPTTGDVAVGGRVLSLLELGTGLNAELTGRQNVINSARLLGFPAEYATGRMAQIESFAELAEFFDRPVRLYSSGMLVRLSFSMFACFDPEIFIVDEALSVGDVFFQQKCVKRIEQMLAAGVTMLFVSHDMQLVRRLCDRAILLSHGRVEFDGPPDECVSRYYSQSPGGAREFDSEPAPATLNGPPRDRAQMIERDVLRGARSRHGGRELELLAATIQGEDGGHTMSVLQSQTVIIRVLLRANRRIQRPSAGLHLFDRLGNLVFAAGTAQLRQDVPPMESGEERVVTFRLTLALQPGEYTLSLGCAELAGADANVGVLSDQCEGLGPIAVHVPQGELARFYGIARLPMEVEIS
jgi:lipopolysaccharide transport system ATP-binding protein